MEFDEEQNYYLKLTNSLYTLTEFFSDEVLKNKVREKALDIFSSLSLAFSPNPEPTIKEKEDLFLQIEKDLEVLEKYLELARLQNFLHSFNFLIIKNEYDKIKKLIKENKRTKGEPVKIESNKEDLKTKGRLNERQEKILKIIKEKGSVQVSTLKEFFPKESKRTLRRDLFFLVKNGFLKREGKWNTVFYKLVQKEG
jgi:predicted HTH transcriptional regulator